MNMGGGAWEADGSAGGSVALVVISSSTLMSSDAGSGVGSGEGASRLLSMAGAGSWAKTGFSKTILFCSIKVTLMIREKILLNLFRLIY